MSNPQALLTQTDAKGRSIVKASRRVLCRFLACSCFCRSSAVLPAVNGSGLKPLLKTQHRTGVKTLVLDLDETLVHSSLQPVSNADFLLTVQVNDLWAKVYVLLRPGVNELLTYALQRYEVVIYTASVKEYADQLLDRLDPEHIAARLYRDQCVLCSGVYVKDLRNLGRPMESLILVDVIFPQNAQEAFDRYPENTLLIASFISDQEDKELRRLKDILELMEGVEDVRNFLGSMDWQEIEKRLRTRKVDTEEAMPSPHI